MASRTLPLELAAAFVAPTDLKAIAFVCRALRGVASDNTYWKEHYARRYPALASLPGLGQPSNARELVRSLLTALPPPPTPLRRSRGRQPLPSAPLNAEGRALPLRGDAILAVQLSRLGRQRPVAYGSVRLADANLHEVEHPPAPDFENDWKFNVHLRLDGADGRRSLMEAFALPSSISLDPENPLRDTEPPFPEVVRHHVLTFDRDFRQELYIVAGDMIYRLDHDADASLDVAMQEFNDRVLFPCQLWAERGTPDPDNVPHLPLRVEYKDLNAVLTSRWHIADYSLDAFLGQLDCFELVWQTQTISMQFHACWEKWGFLLFGDMDSEEAGPDGWNLFCQLLAVARPVTFPRAQAAV